MKKHAFLITSIALSLSSSWAQQKDSADPLERFFHHIPATWSEECMVSPDMQPIKTLNQLACVIEFKKYCELSENGELATAHQILINLDKVGYAMASVYLGIHYKNGVAVPKNGKLAYSYFEKALDKNKFTGPYQLAGCYRDGIGVAIDIKKSAELYLRALNEFNQLLPILQIQKKEYILDIKEFLGKITLEQSHLSPISKELALQFLKECADEGRETARILLGMQSFCGNIQQFLEDQKSFEEFDFSPQSIDHLMRFINGTLEGQNPSEAEKIFSQIPKTSFRYGASQYFLFILNAYMGGYSESKFQNGFKHLKNSADAGYIQAHLSLGDIYSNNHRGYFNLKKAIKHYEIAAQNGNKFALFELSCLSHDANQNTFYLKLLSDATQLDIKTDKEEVSPKAASSAPAPNQISLAEVDQKLNASSFTPDQPSSSGLKASSAKSPVVQANPIPMTSVEVLSKIGVSFSTRKLAKIFEFSTEKNIQDKIIEICEAIQQPQGFQRLDKGLYPKKVKQFLSFRLNIHDRLLLEELEGHRFRIIALSGHYDNDRF